MEDFLMIVGIGISSTLFFGVILGMIAFMRWMRYKETIELAKQGLVHPRYERGNGKMSRGMRFGILTTMIGAAMTCGLMTIGFEPGNSLLGPWLLGGFIPLGIGLALVGIGWINQGGQFRVSSRRSPEHLEDEIHLGDDSIPPHKR